MWPFKTKKTTVSIIAFPEAHIEELYKLRDNMYSDHCYSILARYHFWKFIHQHVPGDYTDDNTDILWDEDIMRPYLKITRQI